MTFKEYLQEARLPSKFNLTINNIKYDIIRDKHVMQKRGNSNLNRDAGMSKNKYKIIFEKGIEFIDKRKPFTLTWTTPNKKSNAISGYILNDSNAIMVFGAIIGRKSNPESLYKAKGTNRYHIGEIDFTKG